MKNNSSEHPGVFIREELIVRSWTQADLSFVTGCHVVVLNRIINKKRGVSPKMSKILGAAFSVSEGLFLKLQSAYDLSNAKEASDLIPKRALEIAARRTE